MREKPLESFDKFEDLKEYRVKVAKWVEEVAHQIHMVYEDDSLKDEVAAAIDDVDVENDTWLEVTDKLKAHIDKRIHRLKDLIAATLSSEGVA